MSFIALLLLFLIVYIVLVPLIKVGIAVYKARKQMRSMFDAMKGADAGSSRTSAQQAPRREKKIDPNVGEYVEFEEIHETAASSNASSSADHTSYPSDPVEDAEWEEIK